MMSKYPLLGMTLIELQSLVKRLGMPGFAAKQIASWLYDKKVTSIDEMTNLSLKYRELLKQNYEVGAEFCGGNALCRRYGEIPVPCGRESFCGVGVYSG